MLPTEKLMSVVMEQASTHKSKPQYMSAVWAQNEQQAEVAKHVAERLGKQAVPILPKSEWHDAEEYHQKYIAKSRGQGHSAACRR